MSPSHATIEALIAAAREASQKAYAPYSNFHVGAAVSAGGEIFIGCNVENASYGLTVCAERNAIAAAVSAGHSSIQAIAIFTNTEAHTTPCGACRQVIAEFAPETGAGIVADVQIHLACASGPALSRSLSELLPEAFRKSDS